MKLLRRAQSATCTYAILVYISFCWFCRRRRGASAPAGGWVTGWFGQEDSVQCLHYIALWAAPWFQNQSNNICSMALGEHCRPFKLTCHRHTHMLSLLLRARESLRSHKYTWDNRVQVCYISHCPTTSSVNTSLQVQTHGIPCPTCYTEELIWLDISTAHVTTPPHLLYSFKQDSKDTICQLYGLFWHVHYAKSLYLGLCHSHCHSVSLVTPLPITGLSS